MGKSLPTMPTSCTGAKWLADAEKNVPEPPSTLSALPKGVSTESSATDPTTRTGIYGLLAIGYWLLAARGGRRPIISHAVGGGDAKQRRAVTEHDLRGPGEH